MNVLIVDDKPDVHKWLKNHLDEFHPSMESLDHAYSLGEARSKVKARRPGLIFLDVELGDGLGFELVEDLKGGPAPHIVVISAKSEYASKAFRVAAIDFLEKPFRLEEFKEALERVETAPTKAEQIDFMSEFQKQPGTQKIIVRGSNEIHYVDVMEIYYLEAFGNYTDIHGSFGKITTTNLIKKMTSALEACYPPESGIRNPFFRTHRTFVVNCSYIIRVEKYPPSKLKMDAVLKVNLKTDPKGEKKIAVGSTFKDAFLKFMELFGKH